MNKVLHIITGLRDGGAESALFRLVVNDKDFKHIVVSLTNEGKYSNLLKNNGIDVHHLNIISIFSIPNAVKKLYRLIRFENPDVVQTWMYHSDFLGGLVAKFARAKKISWGIRNTSLMINQSKFSTIIIRKFCAYLSYIIPDVIVSVSSEAISHHTRIGYNSRIFYLIPNGVDSARFIKKNLNFDELFIIGMVGRFDLQKDLDTLFRAIKLFSILEKKFILKLAGHNMTADNIELVRMIEKYNLIEVVELCGQLYQIESFYQEIHFLVLTSSFGEAFPNVIAEAMCCGTPCIATNVGDSAKIIGDSGWVSEPKDFYGIALSFYKAWNIFRNLKIEYEHLSNKANYIISKNYSLSNMRKNYASVWR